MNRRRFVGAAAAATIAALGVDAAWMEPGWLEVTRHRVPAPSGRRPFVFAQISDLHLRRVGRLHHRVAAEVARARPRFILLTGDSVDRASTLPVLDEFLALLPGVPKYATLGNWEHWSGVDLGELARVYARHNCELLVNGSRHPEIDGTAITISGLDDLVGIPDLRTALAGADPTPVHLVMAHSPEYRDRIVAQAASGVDLTAITMILSGHTHGGQVTLGGWAPLRPPGSGRYLRGWYRDDDAPPLYVSRGIGTSVLPLRFGARPELALFTVGPEVGG
ncbi:MAG TPA: metallophosphoesterase [Longimicrobium sp.]|nr:metallophosphoesterase [Longimicrobium sp.]